MAHAIDRADEISIRDRVRRLLDAPEILRKSSHRGRWVENYFGAVKTKRACPFREVPVVADINADACKRCIKRRITEIAGFEIKLFPESGIYVRDMVLPI